MREHVISEIRRTAADNGGKALGLRAFELATGIQRSLWQGKFWARWSEVVLEAGLQPNKMQGPYSREYLIEIYCSATRLLKHAPTLHELSVFCRQINGFPERNAFLRQFGGMNQLRGAARVWASQNNSFFDIVELLPDSKDFVAHSKSLNSAQEGCVYLLKSGDFFKIGRSDNVERRIKEITITMPENVILIHTIRTDDPPGIEAYWHQRFSGRRAKGEWFKLSSADVRAFKRRNFQ